MVSWDATKPVTITLDRHLGSIQGRLMPPGDHLLTGTIKIGLRPRACQKATNMGPVQLHLSRTVRVDQDGTFRIPELPPGRYELTPEFGPDAPFSAKPVRSQELAPGATISGLEIPLERIPIVSGRVIDETTGQGIAEVSLRAYRLLRGNGLIPGRLATTDGSGNYRVAVEPGTVIIQPDDPPEDLHGHADENRVPGSRSRPIGPGRTSSFHGP